METNKHFAELVEIYKNQNMAVCFALLQFQMEEQLSLVRRDVHSLSEKLEKLENCVQVLERDSSFVQESSVFRTEEEIHENQ